MLQHPSEMEARQPATASSIWRWSKLQSPPSALLWCSLYAVFMLVYGALYLPLFLSFRGFALRDGGSGLVAEDLVRRGMLPAIDFSYYHGLLPFIVERPWFVLFGENPQAYTAVRFLVMILSAIMMFYLFRALQAPRIAYIMFLVAIPFVFFYRPSLNHDLAALTLTGSLLLLAQSRYGSAASAALLSGFCHPSLGYVLFLLVFAAGVWSGIRSSRATLRRNLFSMTGSAAATLIAYAAACLLFFRSIKPLLATLFPVAGKGVRAHYGWSFLKGGIEFIHPPGSNWKYLLGSNAGPYVLFNLILLGISIPALVQIIRQRRIELGMTHIMFFCALAIHVTYVVVAYGVPETWAYEVYLLVLGIAAVPFARARYVSALVMTGVLLLGSFSGLRAALGSYQQTRRGGLWIDDQMSADLQAMLQRVPGAKPYVWSMSGALSMIDSRFQSPARWFVHPQTSPPGELARLQQEMLANPVVFVEGTADDPDFLFHNPDFAAAEARLEQVGRIGGFTVCVRQPETLSKTSVRSNYATFSGHPHLQ